MTESRRDPVVANSKAARQQRILDLLSERDVTSQAELAALLEARGLTATQATLSRDLVELRAEKVRTSAGARVYRVPGEDGRPPVSSPEPIRNAYGARLGKLAEDLLLSALATGSFIVLRTPPGAAQLLGSTIDQSVLPDVLGTIAGDDTVMVICREETDTPLLAQDFLALAEGNGPLAHQPD